MCVACRRIAWAADNVQLARVPEPSLMRHCFRVVFTLQGRFWHGGTALAISGLPKLSIARLGSQVRIA
jgi:hypothetical protein